MNVKNFIKIKNLSKIGKVKVEELFDFYNLFLNA